MQKPGNRDNIAQPGPITLEQGLKRLPTPDGKQSVALFEHGTLQVKLYAPRGTDAQTPHARDEVYVVARGNGWFVNGGHRHRFAIHDVLFAEAGAVHRFEDFSDDFLIWVFFFGPEGGEAQ